MTRRRGRTTVSGAVVAVAALLFSACGPGTAPEDALVADATISDTEAIHRAVEREVLWPDVIGPVLWKAPDPRKPARRGRGIWTDEDESGAPALHLALEAGLGFGSSRRTAPKGEPWTVEQERKMDMFTFSMEGPGLVRVAHVGAARRLRFIEVTFLKTARTGPSEEAASGKTTDPRFPELVLFDPRDRQFEVFRAIIPHERLERLGQTRMEELWQVVLDRYGELTVESER